MCYLRKPVNLASKLTRRLFLPFILVIALSISSVLNMSMSGLSRELVWQCLIDRVIDHLPDLYRCKIFRLEGRAALRSR